MNEPSNRYTFDRVIRLLVSAVVLAAVFLLLRYLSDVLIPFVAAAVLAYLLNPLVTLFERKTKRRWLGVTITIGGIGIVALAMVVVLVPLMAWQFQRFGQSIQKLREDVSASLVAPAVPVPPAPVPPAGAADAGESDEVDGSEPATEKSALGLRELYAWWGEFRGPADDRLPREQQFQQLGDRLAGTYLGQGWESLATFVESDEFDTWLLDLAKRAIAGGWSVITLAVSALLGLTVLIIVLLYLVFLLLDYPAYARGARTLLPPQYRDGVIEFFEEFEVVMRRYFRGQAVVALLMGLLFSIGFTLMGMPLAIPLGLFIGLLNMVPYLQAVGLVPALLLAVLRSIESGASLTSSIVWTLVVFGVAQLLQDAVITPRVMRKATGLKPVAILLGVFVWAKLLGFLGLLLAIPLTGLGIAYYRRFVLEDQSSKDAAQLPTDNT